MRHERLFLAVIFLSLGCYAVSSHPEKEKIEDDVEKNTSGQRQGRSKSDVVLSGSIVFTDKGIVRERPSYNRQENKKITKPFYPKYSSKYTPLPNQDTEKFDSRHGGYGYDSIVQQPLYINAPAPKPHYIPPVTTVTSITKTTQTHTILPFSTITHVSTIIEKDYHTVTPPPPQIPPPRPNIHVTTTQQYLHVTQITMTTRTHAPTKYLSYTKFVTTTTYKKIHPSTVYIPSPQKTITNTISSIISYITPIIDPPIHQALPHYKPPVLVDYHKPIIPQNNYHIQPVNQKPTHLVNHHHHPPLINKGHHHNSNPPHPIHPPHPPHQPPHLSNEYKLPAVDHVPPFPLKPHPTHNVPHKPPHPLPVLNHGPPNHNSQLNHDSYHQPPKGIHKPHQDTDPYQPPPVEDGHHLHEPHHIPQGNEKPNVGVHLQLNLNGHEYKLSKEDIKNAFDNYNPSKYKIITEVDEQNPEYIYDLVNKDDSYTSISTDESFDPSVYEIIKEMNPGKHMIEIPNGKPIKNYYQIINLQKNQVANNRPSLEQNQHQSFVPNHKPIGIHPHKPLVANHRPQFEIYQPKPLIANHRPPIEILQHHPLFNQPFKPPIQPPPPYFDDKEHGNTGHDRPEPLDEHQGEEFPYIHYNIVDQQNLLHELKSTYDHITNNNPSDEGQRFFNSPLVLQNLPPNNLKEMIALIKRLKEPYISKYLEQIRLDVLDRLYS